MPRWVRMHSHASAAGTVAKTGQRARNNLAVVTMFSPKAGDSESDLIPSNIYEQRALDPAEHPQGA